MERFKRVSTSEREVALQRQTFSCRIKARWAVGTGADGGGTHRLRVLAGRAEVASKIRTVSCVLAGGAQGARVRVPIPDKTSISDR